MSLRALGSKLFNHGNFIRQALKRKPPAKPQVRSVSHSSRAQSQVQISPVNKDNKYHVFRKIGVQVSQRARRVLIDDVVNRVNSNFGSDVVQRATHRGLYGYSAPLLSLVGVGVASGQGILTKDDELEGICWEIRDCMSKILWSQNTSQQEESLPVKLSSFTFGKAIAKGANAVVYSAKLATDGATAREDSIASYPLALKMMFNYDIQSNSLAILKAMYREIVPAINVRLEDFDFDFLKQTRLPPHPNIVKVHSVFTDYVPELERCRELYPAALPKRIDPEGEGRNMSLFLVMKRYSDNLQSYLQTFTPLPPRTSALILTQMLEAVTHMVAHNVAHRDLKSDNILLDTSDQLSPVAVVSDFGCCLAQGHGLSVAYTSHDIEKGGNTALMAPEIIGKRPGPFVKLHYDKADLWAIGAIGYEVFGSRNPFYGDKNTKLSSVTYKDEDLPPLPHSVPSILSRLLKNLLRRNPSDRLDPEGAANVCQLFLWAPSAWLDVNCQLPTYQEMLEWLLHLAVKLLCEGNKLSSCEYSLISTFLCRANLAGVRTALNWIRDYEEF